MGFSASGQKVRGVDYDIGKVVDPNAPPPVPDLTDDVVQQARVAARRRLLMGNGLSSTFLTGPLGDPSKPPTSAPKAGGY